MMKNFSLLLGTSLILLLLAQEGQGLKCYMTELSGHEDDIDCDNMPDVLLHDSCLKKGTDYARDLCVAGKTRDRTSPGEGNSTVTLKGWVLKGCGCSEGLESSLKDGGCDINVKANKKWERLCFCKQDLCNKDDGSAGVKSKSSTTPFCHALFLLSPALLLLY